jgi:hypothetical protein
MIFKGKRSVIDLRIPISILCLRLPLRPCLTLFHGASAFLMHRVGICNQLEELVEPSEQLAEQLKEVEFRALGSLQGQGDEYSDQSWSNRTLPTSTRSQPESIIPSIPSNS